MNAFDKIIGYDTVKKELLQICDMIHHEEIYKTLGAKLPKGLLLHGDPGLGKTLMAQCFIRESGLKTYTVRRNKASNDFMKDITTTFEKAKESAPAIVFLDDMDKFANEDRSHKDAEEYVAIQSAIDDVRGHDVFVLATANDIYKLPNSLIRAGRFDRTIELETPTERDAIEIIKHYLKDKKVSKTVNLEDIAMMIKYSSCAELETILNEAAIGAAYERKEEITTEDLVNAVLRMEYDVPDAYTKMSEKDARKIAIHEAGHLVISEVLSPGSIGLVSVKSEGRGSVGGFTRRCEELEENAYYSLISLGGKIASEMYYPEIADGCQEDINRAISQIRNLISYEGAYGVAFLDAKIRYDDNMSENLNSRVEACIHAELERCMLKARKILMNNREFLEKAIEKLVEKETLLYSDIKALRESVTITQVCA